ncbi:putative mitochondrial protein [Vitis vinifera]|uniref:Putative mitochondrial protein n=1 Tax=Vitis vinifera TaxID=29760 RepID=A0A438IH37_VITVI|nr:putative mitochondrial protein [Vitis vinifera]
MQGKNNGEEENRVKKTEDSSCSLLSHFWSTSRSPFSTCYIPFQISGSQESNASNRVRFGAEMRNIWPSEDNCSRLVRKFRTTPSKFAQPMRVISYELLEGEVFNSKFCINPLEPISMTIEREVEFFENLLSDSNSQVPTSVGESLEETPSKVVEQPIVPRKSQRARKEKVLGSDEIDSQRISFYLVEGNREDIIRKIPIVLQIEEDPKTYKEAMASRDVAFWKEAINDEMDSIMSNQTWELVDLPPGSKPIGCKWVFRRKYHTDGMIQTFKARLVAKGFK